MLLGEQALQAEGRLLLQQAERVRAHVPRCLQGHQDPPPWQLTGWTMTSAFFNNFIIDFL